jgi:hypothetical protein
MAADARGARVRLTSPQARPTNPGQHRSEAPMTGPIPFPDLSPEIFSISIGRL